MRVVLLLGLVTALIRLGDLLLNGGLHSAIEYDDGVHYGSALVLTHGEIPYRDFVFLQPPGITLLFTPAAVLGRVTTPFTGFVVVRLATAAVAGLNAILLVRIVSHTATRTRGVVAGSLYALSVPSIVAGSTAMVEPWLSLFMLLSLDQAVGGHARKNASFYAGVLAGLALTVKVWGGVFALLLTFSLLINHRPGDARRVLLGTVTAGTAVLLPFFLLAPHGFMTDILKTQATRPAAGLEGIAARWEDYLGLWALSSDTTVILIPCIAAAMILVFILLRVLRNGPLGSILGLQVLGAIVIFAIARPYYTHYGEYLTLFLAPCVALALPKLPSPKLGWLIHPLPYAAMAFGTLLLFGGWIGVQAVDLARRVQPSSVDTTKLSLSVSRAHCVVSDQMTLAILANAPIRCAWIDPRGTALTMLKGRTPADFYPTGFRNLKSWQSDWQQRLEHADMAILTSSPCEHLEWGEPLCTYVTRDFRLVTVAGSAGPNGLQVQVWKRVRDAAPSAS